MKNKTRKQRIIDAMAAYARSPTVGPVSSGNPI